ncbi:MAG TPA: TolC family protein [Flavobacterium sp.]|nr:TolC family protein [Flavobacterium sp.]
MRKISLLIYVSILGSVYGLKAQNLTLDQSYELAKQNYPLIKQYELIEKSKEYTISNANKAYLPQISITAIEGYVFGDFPSMGASGSDSNFKFIGIGQINQTIWDGGATKSQKKIIEANSEIDKATIEVSLYELRSRVNQLYFGILLINEQLQQLDIQENILNHNIDKVKKLNENGLAYKTDVDEMKVEKLKLNQQKKDFQYTKKGYQTMLSYLIGKNIADTKLEKPVNKFTLDNTIKRPEQLLYSEKRELLKAQSDMQKVNLMPKVGLLGAGIALAPGMNLGNDKISTIGVAGLSVGWDIKGLYKNSNEKQLTEVALNNLALQEETFLFNTKLQLNQKTADIERQQAILKDDDEIITLRQTIREGYQLKYDTGVGPLIDLLNATEKEGNSRAEKALHEIQLLMSTYEYQTIKGN